MMQVDFNPITMSEDKPKYRSVLDHGVEVSLDHLPSIPCSKYIVLGNPKMRVPRKRTQPVIWRVPRLQPRRPRAVFRRVEATDSNEFDRNTIYAEEYKHENLRQLPPLRRDNGQPINTDLMKERQLIRQYCKSARKNAAKMGTKPSDSPRKEKRSKSRVTFKLPPISEASISINLDEGNRGVTRATPDASISPEKSNDRPKYKFVCQSPDHKRVCKGTPVCGGDAREFCDVLGQRYCSCCVAYYNRKKHERLMLPIIRANSPKSVNTASLSRAIQKGAYAKKRSRKKNKALSATCLCTKLPRIESVIGDGNTG